jgi:hypothetical protein
MSELSRQIGKDLSEIIESLQEKRQELYVVL